MCLAIMFVSTLLISSQSHISHSVISNLLHLHSYLMITLLYHCTINTFLHCISLLFVFLFRVHALLQHHSHALLSKYNYHILLNIHMHSLQCYHTVFFICILSFNFLLFILHSTLFPELFTHMQYLQCHNLVTITSQCYHTVSFLTIHLACIHIQCHHTVSQNCSYTFTTSAITLFYNSQYHHTVSV